MNTFERFHMPKKQMLDIRKQSVIIIIVRCWISIIHLSIFSKTHCHVCTISSLLFSLLIYISIKINYFRVKHTILRSVCIVTFLDTFVYKQNA